MASINAPARSTVGSPPKTHEGAIAARITPEQQLRRSVLSCMLWENEFYESGVTIADRIKELVPLVKERVVAELAVETRLKGNLRHVPLLLVRELARLSRTAKPTGKSDEYKVENPSLIAETLYRVIQRPDELTEFLALYWKDGKQPLANQVKRGLAMAFQKFSAYQLAKYNGDGAVKLRDVLFLSHAKPKSDEQDKTWKKLVDKTLESPDTWEVALSGGADKRGTFERLMRENKLGALATLRNLRNMQTVGVETDLVRAYIPQMNTEKVLPFQFISAAKYAPQLEDVLEEAMFKNLADAPKLPGKTVLLIDVSPSMDKPLAGKSERTRRDAAIGLGMLVREICETGIIFGFESGVHAVPPRRGFGLRDAILRLPSNGTLLGKAVTTIDEQVPYDRLIVITDEESQDPVPAPKGVGYMINVASAQNGVGYKEWTHIDGFSESVVDYIRELEAAGVNG